MKIVGTIVEFNPLHKGHLYAINKIKEDSQADVLVVILSGNFTMRGDLSLFDKFEKTRQALKANVDLVLELPFVYTVQNSDIFAKNAVKLLHLAKVEELWFGSESNNSDQYASYYQKWQSKEAQNQIQNLLQQGSSYKEATYSVIDLPSNDLLGFSYYKAIREGGYSISIHTIKRIGEFSSKEAKEFASSYAIRSNLKLMKDYCPSYVKESLLRDKNKLFPYLKYQILNTNTTLLKELFFMEEGLENRFKKINGFTSIDAYIDFLVTKRYTLSRIQRGLAYVLFGITKQEMKGLPEPNFIRVLGYSSLGKTYLGSIKKDTLIYTNIKEGLHQALDIELKITKLLDLFYNSNTIKAEQGRPQEIR